MLLLVGLGNPGDQYVDNRHNVGFLAIEEIARRHRFGPWRKKFQAQISDGQLGGEKILLIKPQTFMNNSGQAVGQAMRFYKLDPSDVTVIYDEIDLAPGKMKLKVGGGAAGHNGIRDIASHIGPAFRRVRIGVGHPGDKSKVMKHVLSDFSTADDLWLDPMLDAIAEAAPLLAQGEDAKFQSRVALLTQPKKDKESDGV
ncbi:MAG: aminoacyl-tRNA hydrolase [Alphaproteobacteria bacterium]